MSERDDSSKEVAASGRPKPPNAGKGRPKGSLNKTTASIKAALLEAFEKRGGVDALVSWGDDNPTEFYKLIGRLVPHEVSGPDGAPLDAGEKYYVILGGQKVPF